MRRTVTALTADYRTGLLRRRALDLHEAIPAQHTTSALYENYATSWPAENNGSRNGQPRPAPLTTPS